MRILSLFYSSSFPRDLKEVKAEVKAKELKEVKAKEVKEEVSVELKLPAALADMRQDAETWKALQAILVPLI